MKNTGEICLVRVFDSNREEGFRVVDLGNYYLSDDGQKCLITTEKLAVEFGHLVNVPIYIFK